MAEPVDVIRDLRVLQKKRDAMRYQILVRIAERQPAVSQAEIAEEVGVTAQAVSEYLKGLVEDHHVNKLGRGRYEITTEGVDWLISQNDALLDFTQYVAEEVVGRVDIDTAIATDPISKGDRVSLSMHEGVLHATPGESGSATAVATTDAKPQQDVGVTDFEGLLDFELGQVTIVVVPPIQEGGSTAIESDDLVDHAERHDLIAIAGASALAAAIATEISPDVRFGTPEAVKEASMKGLDVLVIASTDSISRHTDRLRESDIPYEVIESSG